MTSAAELQVRFTATGAQQVQGEIAKTGNAVKGFGNIATKMGTAVGTAFGVVAGAGITMMVGSLSGLISGTNSYSRELANVNSLLQLTDSGIKQVDSSLLKLAQNPAITDSPTELAAGLYQAISSGYSDVNDALLIVESSAKAATAGQTNTAVAVGASTAVLNAYGLAATDVNSVNDIMFQTVNDGVVTYEQLGNNMGQVLPIASQLGIGFDELGAAYATATVQGIGVSQTETGIANVMRAALNPTDALTAAVQNQGYATAQQAIETEGLNGFLGILQEESGGSTEKLFDMLGTTEGVNMALALGSEKNLPKYNEELERMQHASDGVGAAQKALDKQMRSSAFAIDKAKQSVQVLATMVMGKLAPGITFAARGLTSFITKGLIPFGNVIGKAFKGGNDFRKLVEQFPEPLQRAIGAFGSIAESIGDVARAFGDRGLAGAMQTLLEGGELHQIGTALSAIADEAWNAIKAGFDAIPWGTLWDVAVMGIKAAAGLAFDLGKVTVSAGIELAGDILDAAGDIWGWVLKKLYGGSDGGPAGMAAGGVGGKLEQYGIAGGHTIPIGQVLIDGTVALGNGLLSVAGDLWGWVQGKLFGGGGGPSGPFQPGTFGRAGSTASMAGHSIPIGTVLIEGAAELAGELLKLQSGFNAWLVSKVGTLSAKLEAKITISPSSDFSQAAYKAGHDAGQTGSENFSRGLSEAFAAVLRGGGGGGAGSGGGGGGASGLLLPLEIKMAIDKFIGGFVVGVGQTLAHNFATNMKMMANPFIELPGIISGFLSDAISGLNSSLAGVFNGTSGNATGLFNDMGDQILGDTSGIFDEISQILNDSLIGEIADIAGMVPGWKDGIVSAVEDIIPKSGDVDLTMPTLNIDITGVGGVVSTAIDGLNALTDALTSAWNRLTGAQNLVNPPDGNNRPTDRGAGASPGRGTAPGVPGQGSMPGVTPIGEKTPLVGTLPRQKMPEIDLSEYQKSIDTMPGLLAKGIAAAHTLGASGAAQIGAVIGTAFGTMVGNVTALMGAFTNAVGQGMSNSLAATATYTAAIVSATQTSFGQIPGIVAAAVGPVPGIIAGALSGAAGVAFSMGANIGASLAAGINSQIGAVAAAAANLAAAAEAATAARAKIASPSKVFMELGGYIGEGFALGIKQTFPDVNRTGRALVAASVAAQNQRYASSGASYGESTGRNGISGSGPVTYNTGPKYYGSVTLMPQSPEVHQAISSSAIRRGRP